MLGRNLFLLIYYVFLEFIVLMYFYGEDVGDFVIIFDIRGKKCFKINIFDGGMVFFGKWYRKFYVSFLSCLMICRFNDNK